MKFIVSLVAIALVGSVLFVVLLELFISGGAGNPQDQSQGSQAEQPKKERTGGEKAKKEAEKLESMEGIVVKSASDKHAVIVKPDNGERQLFTYKQDEVKVTLDGKEAGPDAIDKGQKAEIGYKEVTTKKDREVNVARSIELQSKNGSSGDDSTG